MDQPAALLSGRAPEHFDYASHARGCRTSVEQKSEGSSGKILQNRLDKARVLSNLLSQSTRARRSNQ
jgi:hypothetical protein